MTRNDILFSRLLEDELRVSKVQSPYIHRMLLALHSVRDIQDVATIVAQTLIAIEASERTSKEMLISAIERIPLTNVIP